MKIPMVSMWVVVLFLKDSSVSTVPSKWLLSNQTDEQLECYWPSKKIRQHIQNACDFTEEWEKFQVKILHETDDYDNAKYFEKTCSEDECSDTLSEFPKEMRKRKSSRNKDFVSDPSSDDDLYLPPLPKLTKKTLVVTKKTLEINDKTLEVNINTLEASNKSTGIPEANYIPDNEKLESQYESDHSNSTSSTLSINEETMMEMDKIIMPPPATTNIPKKTQSDINHKPEDCCCIHVQRLNDHVVTIRTLLNEHINQIKKILPQAASESTINSFETVPQNVFKKHKQLVKYEELLEKSDTARKQLETLFFIGGGNCVNEMIKRGLIRFFSNKLAKKCSWYGRKNNYPLNNLKIISTLRDAARKRFPNMSDCEFEKYTGTWFRQSSLRFQRETSSQSQ